MNNIIHERIIGKRSIRCIQMVTDCWFSSFHLFFAQALVQDTFSVQDAKVTPIFFFFLQNNNLWSKETKKALCINYSIEDLITQRSTHPQ